MMRTSSAAAAQQQKRKERPLTSYFGTKTTATTAATADNIDTGETTTTTTTTTNNNKRVKKTEKRHTNSNGGGQRNHHQRRPNNSDLEDRVSAGRRRQQQAASNTTTTTTTTTTTALTNSLRATTTSSSNIHNNTTRRTQQQKNKNKKKTTATITKTTSKEGLHVVVCSSSSNSTSEEQTNSTNDAEEEEQETNTAQQQHDENDQDQKPETATSKDTETGEGAAAAAAAAAAPTARRTPKTLKKNIVYQLLDRSILGKHRGGNKVEIPRNNQTWKTVPWIELNHVGAAITANGNNSSSYNCQKIRTRHLAWDEMGVLLAAGSENCLLRIYDWDTVLSTDQKGRNKVARQKENTGAFSIEPILTFRVRHEGSSLTCLKWNPYNADELVVGTSSGHVYIYDVAAVNGWIQQQRSVGPQPRRTLTCGGSSATGHDAVTSVQFVNDGKYLLVGYGCRLFCFDTITLKKLWKLDWNKRLSSIATLYSEIVLVGSACGSFCLVNWKQYQMSSFSRLASPKVLSEWLSYRGLETPGSTHMGIRHLRVEMLPYPPSNAAVTPTRCRRCEVTWVTTCGWVMRSIIEPPTTGTTNNRVTKHIDLQILLSTTPVKVLNSQGDKVRPSQKSWSLPIGSCASHGTRDLLICEKVADVTQILPHHDNRVLAAQPRFVRPKSRPGLQLLWTDTKQDNRIASSPISPPSIQSCTLSRRKGRPVALAIHPSHEWIVVAAEDNGMYALGTRAGV